jgi:hypothetical protein
MQKRPSVHLRVPSEGMCMWSYQAISGHSICPEQGMRVLVQRQFFVTKVLSDLMPAPQNTKPWYLLA